VLQAGVAGVASVAGAPCGVVVMLHRRRRVRVGMLRVGVVVHVQAHEEITDWFVARFPRREGIADRAIAEILERFHHTGF
jgi:hypothetical protein